MNTTLSFATANDEYRSRGVHLIGVATPTPNAPLYARSWALVVGIDRYRGNGGGPLIFHGNAEFRGLSNAKKDAEAVAALLRDEFAFEEVKELCDEQATKAEIEKQLKVVLRDSTQKDDRVVIFFAGHGHTQKVDHGGDVGHLLTFGAQDISQAISMDDLRNWLKLIPAKHIFLILDCCFSGSVAFTEPFTAQRIREGGDYLQALTNSSSWQVLTAGRADETVADSGVSPGHSAFTASLLAGLRGAADPNRDGVITASSLAEYVKKQVINETQHLGGRQEPVFRQLLNGETGEVLFLTRRRRLQDKLNRSLLKAIHETALPDSVVSGAYVAVGQIQGRTSDLDAPTPAAILSQLWNWDGSSNTHSPILRFVNELALQHPAIAAQCAEWRTQALAEPALGLRWPGVPIPQAAPKTDYGKTLPFLTVSLDPMDPSPGVPPQSKSYRLNIYFWHTQANIGDEKICTLGQAKAEVDRVIRQEIGLNYSDQATQLAVEFCLPLELLSDAVDRWPKKKGGMGSVALGIDHPVIIRSIDGLRSDSRRPYWQQKWDSFKKALHDDHAPHLLPPICRVHDYTPSSIYNHYQLSNTHCLGLTEMPPPQWGVPTPLTELLEAGIPIALWPRTFGADETGEEQIHQALQALFEDGPVKTLPDRMRRARSESTDGDLTRHLVLFWDDFDRIPPAYRELEEEAFTDSNLN